MIFLRSKTRTRRTTNSGGSGSSSNSRININERLASIGGLFGALSIIITGALLYAIFTAKSEDKWYYITAVLINVALLVLLMLGAIVFDRYYLKKWASLRTTTTINRLPTSTISNGTTIYDRTTSNISTSGTVGGGGGGQYSDAFNNNNNCSAIMNDIPPQYPGYYPTNIFHNNNNNNQSSQQAQLLLQQQQQMENNNNNNILLISAVNNDLPLNIAAASLLNPTISSSISPTSMEKTDKLNLQLPPNYFDLYPSNNNNNNTQLKNDNNNKPVLITTENRVKSNNEDDFSSV